jgi:hypothetical protein
MIEHKMQDKVVRYTAYALELSKALVAEDRGENCCYEGGDAEKKSYEVHGVAL